MTCTFVSSCSAQHIYLQIKYRPVTSPLDGGLCVCVGGEGLVVEMHPVPFDLDEGGQCADRAVKHKCL